MIRALLLPYISTLLRRLYSNDSQILHNWPSTFSHNVFTLYQGDHMQMSTRSSRCPFDIDLLTIIILASLHHFLTIIIPAPLCTFLMILCASMSHLWRFWSLFYASMPFLNDYHPFYLPMRPWRLSSLPCATLSLTISISFPLSLFFRLSKEKKKTKEMRCEDCI